MKKFLLFLLVATCMNQFAFSQCDPSAHDWGSATFGVSPDPQQGETFQNGYLGVTYADIIYVLAPTNAGDIDSTFADFNVAIDSLILDSITLFNGIADVSLSAIGLDVTCNNNGDSPNPCSFLGGNPYCGNIDGIPTAAGTFPVKIYVTAFINFFGPQAIPYQFENYSLTILDPNVVAEATSNFEVSLAQNTPNPSDNVTQIGFTLPFNSDVRITIQNLIGDRVIDKLIQGKKGENTYRVDSTILQSGIYLYSMQVGDKRITKRMVVQH